MIHWIKRQVVCRFRGHRWAVNHESKPLRHRIECSYCGKPKNMRDVLREKIAALRESER